MMQEADVLERAVCPLMLPYPGCRAVEDLWVDVNDLSGLSECLEHERREPEAALGVVVAKRGKAAVISHVRQFALIADQHQVFGLGHDLGLELSGLLQVPRDIHVRREQNHVLLAAAKRHLEQFIKPLDALRHETARQRDVRAAGILNGVERHRGQEFVAATSL